MTPSSASEFLDANPHKNPHELTDDNKPHPSPMEPIRFTYISILIVTIGQKINSSCCFEALSGAVHAT